MTDENTLTQNKKEGVGTLDPSIFIERITPSRFETWYREREIRKNIRDGKPYFNGPSDIQPPERHSPSQLLQCHRKITYRELNSPEEQGDATGILWFGSRFEEEVALPFLQEVVTSPETYTCNSLWIDFEVETDAGPLRVRGSTDPAIVTSDGTPILLTEIKTKSSVDYLDSPNQHHKAQLHAYMYGLSEKYDRKITDAIIIYGSRETLEIEAFAVEFDPVFWSDTALDWAQTATEYRLREDLPPANPVFDWECEFCDFQHRCGKADTEYDDVGPAGFLPGFIYPKAKVIEYLQAHEDAALTPTLAHEHQDLAKEYDVLPWQCAACGEEYAWDAPDCNYDSDGPPLCPDCLADGTPVPLKAPDPEDQHSISGGVSDG